MSDYVMRDGRRIEIGTIDTGATSKRKKQRSSEPYIGCPVSWLKRILPVVQSKDQLAVAIWLYRRRVVCGSDVFPVSNQEILAELGVDRRVKYRTLSHLEEARIITVTRRGKSATRVQMLEGK